jgi:hypothetical protein
MAILGIPNQPKNFFLREQVAQRVSGLPLPVAF